MKIAVYEDNPWIIPYRYGSISQRHLVDLYLAKDGDLKYANWDDQFSRAKKEWSSFKYNKLYQGNMDELLQQEIPDADLFLVDGLKWKCFELLPQLPPDKTYLVTDNIDIMKHALIEGWNYQESTNINQLVEEIEMDMLEE